MRYTACHKSKSPWVLVSVQKYNPVDREQSSFPTYIYHTHFCAALQGVFRSSNGRHILFRCRSTAFAAAILGGWPKHSTVYGGTFLTTPTLARTPEDQAILQRHVTNLTGNIYCIMNLPEEVVAVMFAYVSRSAHSFRDNLLRLIKDKEIDTATLIAAYADTNVPLDAAQEKARDFHERITLGYGHSSVSELSTARIGIERVSRIASAELELANPFLSFIEYSQRYQKPQQGDVFEPEVLRDHPDLQELFQTTCDQLYAAYEALNKGLLPYLRKEIPRNEGETDARYESRIEKIAFEDARYVLPLATLTNLGMVGNARAIRDAIVRLLSSTYPESVRMAEDIRDEVLKVLPTLVRHAKPSPYQASAQEALERLVYQNTLGSTASEQSTSISPAELPDVELLDFTGAGTKDPEAEAMRALLDMALCHGGITGTELPQLGLEAATHETLLQAVNILKEGMGPHDNPIDAFSAVRYRVRFVVSEANWHQLLRHCRKMRFSWSYPRRDLGVVIPPHIKEAGLTDPFMAAIELSNEAARKLDAVSPRAADYVVTNAHRRFVTAEFDLWELFHLINLRTTPEAQWDIRQTIEELERQIQQVHPNLIAGARRR